MKGIISFASLITALLMTPVAWSTATVAGSSQGSAPQLLGRALLGQANDVVVIGNIAYVATGSGLSIADVTTPAAPVERGRLYLPGEGLAVSVSGSRVYLAGGSEGFFIVAASDITQPQVIGQIASRYAIDMAIVGTVGYFSDGDGLAIFDITEPEFPMFLARLGLSGFVHAVVVRDGLAFVAAGDAGLHLIDVRTPTAPRLLATFDTPDEALGIALERQYAYIADVTSIIILDLSDPARPKQAGQFVFDGLAHDLSVKSNTLFAVGSLNPALAQLSIIDVGNPSRPRLVSSLTLTSDALRLVVETNRAYVAARCGGMMIVDVSRSTAPRLVGTYAEPSCFTDVAAFGTTVFVARFLKDIAIVDASNPAKPRRVGSITGSVPCVIESRALLAVADSRGIALYSLTNPTSPTLQGRLNLRDMPVVHTIAASGTLIAVGTSDSIILVDASNSRAPRQVSLLQGSTLKLAFDGGLLCAAHGTAGLSVVNISTPSRPRVVAQTTSVNQLLGATAVAAGSGQVFLGESYTGVRVLSLSTAMSLSEVTRYDSPGPAQLLVQGSKLYVADLFLGLQIVEVADPTRLNLIASFTPGGLATGLAIGENRIYLVDQSSGLLILQP